MRNSLRYWLGTGVVLVGAWAFLWKSPEQVLIERVEQAVNLLNHPPLATATAWEVFREPATLHVGSNVNQVLSHQSARAAWLAWQAATGFGVVELESVQAQVEAGIVTAQLALGSQPGDLHAQRYPLRVLFDATKNPHHARIAEVWLDAAPRGLPEARP